MGLGPWNGKRHLPISKWEGSWAEEQTISRGANAAVRGVPYSQNPERSPAGKLAWSKGHNNMRVTMAIHRDQGLLTS